MSQAPLCDHHSTVLAHDEPVPMALGRRGASVPWAAPQLLRFPGAQGIEQLARRVRRNAGDAEVLVLRPDRQVKGESQGKGRQSSSSRPARRWRTSALKRA